jgi:SepF-like predicted cell division protein (DUF552 family)
MAKTLCRQKRMGIPLKLKEKKQKAKVAQFIERIEAEEVEEAKMPEKAAVEGYVKAPEIYSNQPIKTAVRHQQSNN